MKPLTVASCTFLLAGAAFAHTVTQDGGTNVRSGPSQGDKLVGIAKKGCIVNVLTLKKDGWRRIDQPFDGWIRSATLKDTSHKMWVDVKEAEIHVEARGDSKRLKVVKDGAEIRTVYSTPDGGWVRIAKPVHGWILHSKLTTKPPGPAAPDTHHGLQWSLYVYAQTKAQFPRVTNMGIYNYRKIAGTNTWSEHAWANAVDFGVPSMAYGDTVKRWLANQTGRFNIDNLLWRVEGHYDHIHVDFNWNHGSTPPRL